MTETVQGGPRPPLHRGAQKALGDSCAGIPPGMMLQKPLPENSSKEPGSDESDEVDFRNGVHHLATGTSCPTVLK